MNSQVKTKEELGLMRESGRIAAAILSETQKAAKPQVATEDLNKLVEELIIEYSKKLQEKEQKENKDSPWCEGEILRPAFLGESSGRNGELYPAVICLSINSTVVHGVPSQDRLKDGDILSLDLGVIYKGYYSDTAITVPVGNVSPEARRLIDVTKRALRQGIKKVHPGNTIGDIGNTIQRWVESRGFQVVRDLCGHGIGKELHEPPEVPNYGKRHTGEVLKEGMVIAIEPMVNAGSWEVIYGPDNQSFITKDGSLSAHFEHTVAVTKEGCEVLTKI